jgi:alpha-2-macroglobulin
VEVTLTTPPSKRSLTIGNVAVVDPLPGGFEVENPRLATSAGRDLVQLSAADRVEFLDDRVVLFTSADANTRRFSWFLRVVSVGNFTIPPVQASCMYRPELSSISGKGKLEVRR